MQTSHRNAQTGFTNILLLLVMLIYFYIHMAVFPDIPGIKIRLLLFLSILSETVWRPLLKTESIAFQLFQVHFSPNSPVEM